MNGPSLSPAADLSSAAFDDDEFLQAIVWRRRAPRALVEPAGRGDVDAFCAALRDDLRARFRRIDPQTHGLLWQPDLLLGVRPGESSRMRTLLERHEQLTGRRRERDKRRRSNGRAAKNGHAAPVVGSAPPDEWLNGLQAPEPPTAVEALLLLDLLITQGPSLPGDELWTLWRTALEWSTALAGESDAAAAAPERGSLDVEQLQRYGELPWMAGLVLEAVSGAGRLKKAGRRFRRAELAAQIGDDGAPDPRWLPALPVWLSSHARCGELARRAGEEKLWNAAAERRWRRLFSVAAALSGADGRCVLPGGNDSAESAGPRADWTELISVAATEIEVPPHESLKLLKHLGSRKRRPEGASKLRSHRDRPGVQSDEARLAVLRSDWSPTADVLAVAHDRSLPLVALAGGGEPLLAGRWELELRVDGRTLSLADHWECVCWHSDADGDYCELQQTIGDVHVERQFLLARGGRYALFADCVSGAGDSRVELSSRLPLAEGIAATAERPTREVRLSDASRPATDKRGVDGPLARVFPLAMPQDRTLSVAGAFEIAEDSLALRLSGLGGLYSPVLLDWHPRRRLAPAQWRMLTIVEEGRRLKAGEAGGYRLRLGRHHLLAFRSLCRPGAYRTVLGHHTRYETVVGRFTEDGEVEPVLLVEGA
ncbi:MAG: hypothetical protein KY476_15925 [Planctomycetes bacterium]|nr:hypothetical protein [Planctomycetota bacterium]